MILRWMVGLEVEVEVEGVVGEEGMFLGKLRRGDQEYFLCFVKP